MTTIEKLHTLVPHWIEHNASHGAEFRTWAAAARAEGAEDVAKYLDQAAANMALTGELLQKTGLGTARHDSDHDHKHERDHAHV